METKPKRSKFVLYTNPNNITNRAYTTRGARDVNNVLRSARTYPDSYTILSQGMGTEADIQKHQSYFPHYQF
jgi:hypothetical protein